MTTAENPQPQFPDPVLDALTPEQLAQLVNEVAPDAFYQRANAFGQAGARLQDVLERVRHQLNVVQESWTGNGASDFDSLARTLIGRLGDVVNAMENPAYSTILNSTGDVLAAHQRRLADLQGQKAQQDGTSGAPPTPEAEKAHTDSVKQVLLDLRLAYWDVGNLMNPVPGQGPAVQTTVDPANPTGGNPAGATGKPVVHKVLDGPPLMLPVNTLPLSELPIHQPIVGKDGLIHGDPSSAHYGFGGTLDRYDPPGQTTKPEIWLGPGPEISSWHEPFDPRFVVPDSVPVPGGVLGRPLAPEVTTKPVVTGRPEATTKPEVVTKPVVTGKPLLGKKAKEKTKAKKDKPDVRTTSAEPASEPALKAEQHVVGADGRPVPASKSISIGAITTSAHSVVGPVNPADRGMSAPTGQLESVKTPVEPKPGSGTTGHTQPGEPAPQPGGAPMSPMMMGGMGGAGMTPDGRMAAMPVEPRPDAFPLAGKEGGTLGRRAAKETEPAREDMQTKLTEKFAELDRLLERGK